ncbi:MAG: peptidylprolyl isomerase [Pseudomonadota bacterium]
MGETVKAGDKIAIHYTGTLRDGSQFDSSEGRAPLEFTVGAGQIIAGLEAVLPGMAAGERKCVDIAADDAYGQVNPQLRQVIPREGIPPDIPLEVGTELQMQTPDGTPLPVRVVAADAATVTLDANHALAGEDLRFDFEVVRIG